ncbi:hypothetical protein [Geopseudomonas aromaticivorans]
MNTTLKELAKSAVNVFSADAGDRQEARAAQAAYYERMFYSLTPEERVAKANDSGHFLIWLPKERLAAAIADLRKPAGLLGFRILIIKLIRSAIYHGDMPALATILEAVRDSKGIMLPIGIEEIGPWSHAVVDVFAAHPNAIPLRFALPCPHEADVSWQGFIKLLKLTAKETRDGAIPELQEGDWKALSWLFHLDLAGELDDDLFSPATRDLIAVNFLICSAERYRTCPVVNAYIRSHSPEKLRALFERTHPDFAEHPTWASALEAACTVTTEQLLLTA